MEKKKTFRLVVYMERAAVDGEHQSFLSNFNPRAVIHGQRAGRRAYSKKAPVRTSRGRKVQNRHLAGRFVARIKLLGSEASFLRATTPEGSSSR